MDKTMCQNDKYLKFQNTYEKIIKNSINKKNIMCAMKHLNR